MLRLALVGGDTLLGREIEEVIENRGTAAAITPYAASGEGNFGEQEGEAIYLAPLEAASISEDRAVLIAGSAEGALKAYGIVKAAGGRPLVIDCTGHLDQEPEARIVAPLLGLPNLNSSWLIVLSHPAASALALVLTRLSRYRAVERAVVHIFEPASERGKRGISELQQQTTSLLSFKSLDKAVFDAQLSFNLLAQYGQQAPGKLSAIEQRIERHVATLLSHQPSSRPLPMPSLRLVQVPVFHGYSMSLWLEFEVDIQAGEIEHALASAQIEIRGQDQEAPTNAGIASQSGLAVGDIRVDRNNSRAAWIWVVADNLRLTADAAADVLGVLTAEER